MTVLVSMVMIIVMMVVVAGGLGFAGAAGELVDQLDELIRRGVVLPGHVPGLDGDGSILQDRQLHFGLHVRPPFRSKSLFSVFTTFCQPIFRQA